MITVFFNEDGYIVAGENIEAARHCSPATTIRGDRIFQNIHHAYKVLYLALCEVRDANSIEDVMIHNDSRIIDEINGFTEPLDETCSEWLQILKRNVIPTIRSVVFFRKKPTTHVNSTISSAHERMLAKLDTQTRDAITARETKTRKDHMRSRSKRLVDRLRLSWFGEKTNG